MRSPFFQHPKIKLSNRKTFLVEVKNYTKENKYIQSARLNG
ncbi:glycoside hydrolase domain-containing protein [Pedobacter sp. CG_S7]